VFYLSMVIGVLILSPIIDVMIPDKREKSFIKLNRFVLILSSLAIFAFLLVTISTTGFQAVGHPTFQALQLTKDARAFNSGLSGLSEDLWAFGTFPWLVAAITFYFTRNWVLSIAMFFILGEIFWVSWHYARYSQDFLATVYTSIFGFINLSVSFFTGQLVLTHVFHFFNNFFAELFRETVLINVVTLLIFNIYFWIGAVVLFGIVWFGLKRRENG